MLNDASSETQYETIENILRDFWSIYVVNVNVLAADDKCSGVKMYTYFPYSTMQCEQAIPIVINQYVDGTFLNPVEFPDKFGNMHGCRIFAAPFEFRPYVILEKNQNGSSELHGIDISVVKTIASMLNFTVAFKFIPPQSEYSKMDETIFGMV